MNFEKELGRLKELLKKEGRGLKYDEIIDKLQWGTKHKKDIKINLENWIAQGDITLNSKKKYNLPESSGLVKGTVSMVTDRFAFVDTVNEGIFVPKSEFNNALDGDTVLVRITKVDEKNRKKEGTIVSILTHSKDRIVGVLQINGNYGFVIPTKAFGKDIYIPDGRLGMAQNNDMVVVQITFWGDSHRKPEGEIIEVIGDGKNTDNLIKGVIAREGLRDEFPDEVISSARKIPVVIKESDLNGRKDLRKLRIITIDGADAKDLDDAVYVEKMSNGNYKLIVAIADVSHYIKEKSILDKEAYQRGNSVYLVDRVLPMLPQEISNGICSLNEREDKLTFTCEMEINATGEVVNSDIYESVINSVHRMTYTDVNHIINGNVDLTSKYADISEMIFQMLELSKIIRNKKYESGNIDFDIPEIKVILDDNNEVLSVEKRERGESERIIEDFMIKANETVAEKLFYMEIPSIYRTHEKPDIQRIKTLNETLMKFHYRVSQNEGTLHSKQFQEIIEKSKADGNSLLVHKMVLMALKQAHYTMENYGHFGLASKCYTHFTSPIRRYSDLKVHRILKSVLKSYPTQKEIEKNEIEIPSICDHISKAERVAMKAEEETVKIKVVEYMSNKIGDEFEGTITGFSNKKIFFETNELIECYWDVVQSDNFYEFSEKDYTMRDRDSGAIYNLGDKYSIILVRASLKDLELEVVPKFLLKTNKK
ncbi:ribonuclease R [Fusobacterium sp. PH5-44]|uniref:ribonuclease R n=1 Tax=unclassified Fusobacterium TaxID=2648384 RepID=UPI003D1AB6B4